MSALDKIDASGFRWKGYRMVAVKVDEHRQVHLLEEGGAQTVCRNHPARDFVDWTVATGWPDCNACKDEAFRRMVAA